jgi:hypothetical protein
MAADMEKAEAGRLAAEAAGEEWTGGDGIMVPTPNGNLVHSHHWVCARQAEDKVSKFLRAFGLSPSARTAVSVGKTGKIDESMEWEI